MVIPTLQSCHLFPDKTFSTRIFEMVSEYFKKKCISKVQQEDDKQCCAGYFQSVIYYIFLVINYLHFKVIYYVTIRYCCLRRVINYLLHYFIVTFNGMSINLYRTITKINVKDLFK